MIGGIEGLTREIGSEFWTEKHFGYGIADCLPEHYEVAYTLSGRTALDMIIEDIISRKQVSRVYLPSYCCHTMILPFQRHGIQAEFYDVLPGPGGIVCGFGENSCDIIFLIQYFGYEVPGIHDFARQEKERGKIIIYDDTHSLFSGFEKPCADYIMASCRKWFGVNAGFAACRTMWNIKGPSAGNDVYVNKRTEAFDLKADYIRNGAPEDKEHFLRLFREAEELLETDYSRYAPDERSMEILKKTDTRKLIEKRRKNAAVLKEGLGQTGAQCRVLYPHIGEKDCPLFVPVIVPRNRDALRKYLIEHEIYLPVHWPASKAHNLNQESRRLYETELSVVCDQRYDTEDMERIIETIHDFYRRKT